VRPIRRGSKQQDEPLGGCLRLVDSVEIGPRELRLGSGAVCHTEAVVGYPSQVGPGWLEPVVTHGGPVDVAMHIDPVPSSVAVARLRKQMARLESSRRLDANKGRLGDPDVRAAAEDARELADRLARGDGRLFSLGVYVTARGADADEAGKEAARLRALLDSMMLSAVPTTWRALQGWLSTLPLGLDLIRMRRTVDTAALAASFPFASGEPSQVGGVLWGRNARTGGIVTWDRWAQRNANSVVLASSGAGKSYLVKLELLRSLYRGIEASVVDPEDEYGRLSAAVGGTTVRLGRNGVRLNPFDLDGGADALDRRMQFIHTLVAVLLREPLDADEAAALDRGLHAAYSRRGINGDPVTHRRPAPQMRDLADALREADDATGRRLAKRLAPFTSGSHRGLFDGPTSAATDGHLVVYSLRHLPDEMRAAGTLLVLDAVWRRVAAGDRQRRLVVVDEAWQLMRDPAGARFLLTLAKSARKHWAALSVVTQDAADLLASDLGMAVVGNAATQVLMRQEPPAMPALADAFRLSQGEQQFLREASRGEGLLLAGTDRVGFSTIASPFEHRVATTDPSELADMDDEEEAG
jgi:type IV secretory pathway VirB4 component